MMQIYLKGHKTKNWNSNFKRDQKNEDRSIDALLGYFCLSKYSKKIKNVSKENTSKKLVEGGHCICQLT